MNKKFNDDEVLNIVIVGHVDHGKSSFVGRLLYDIGEINDEKVNELKKASQKRGVDFEFAFLLDALQDERDQGITIDTTRIFLNQKRKYVFIDAPGHKEFIKNMITGASSADIAILIVDVYEGIKQQTKKHAYLLKLLGVEKVITVFNKMDKIKYDQKLYIKIKSDLDSFLSGLGISLITDIPVSSKIGDNVVKKSKNMPWFSGIPFIDILDNFENSSSVASQHIRFPVQDIYKIGDKRVIVGKIELGSISKGIDLLFLPSNERAKVKSLEIWPKAKKKYFAGDSVGITLDEPIFVDKGNLASDLISPPKLMNRFESNMFWLSEKN